MIFVIFETELAPDDRATFDQAVAGATAAVKAAPQGTLAYEWFADATGEQAIVIDIYRDVAALPPHSANAGPVMAEIFAIVDSKLELYGAAPEAMQRAMAEKRGATYGGPRIAGLA